MNYILFDDKVYENLLPLTFTRPVSEIKFGILTIKEKWEKYLECNISYLSLNYLRDKYPLVLKENNTFINSSICPDRKLVDAIIALENNSLMFSGEKLIAIKLDDIISENLAVLELLSLNEIIKDKSIISKEYLNSYKGINQLWDIFFYNADAINNDFELITRGRKSAKASKTNNIIGEENLFIEEGAIIECSTLNASTGKIYIGKNAEIMENCSIRGPFALCQNATLKMATKIYGATTIGPYCKVGGEVSNSVFLGFSNKAHDGFIGNSVIGEWCNLGADTNNSNLKNTYDNVKLWNYALNDYIDTGLQFCGLIMGDHSKCAINTMFNTGTVIGVSTNLFGSGFQPRIIPSFTWVGNNDKLEFFIDKAISIAKSIYLRRKIVFNKIEENILIQIFENTKKQRDQFLKQ